MSIGECIQSYRKEKGFTQKKLGELAGVATGTIQQYELGKRQPRVEQLYKIANALNIPVSNLLVACYEEHKTKAAERFNGLEPDSISDEDLEEIFADVNQDLMAAIQFKGDIFHESCNQAIDRISCYLRSLSMEGHDEAVKRIEELTHLPKYKREISLD